MQWFRRIGVFLHDSPADDEALLVRCLYGLPNLTDMSAYREKAPLTRSMIERKQVLAVVLLQCLLALFVVLASH